MRLYVDVDWSQFKSLARFFFVRVWWSFFVHNHDPIDDAEWQLWDHPKRFNLGSWFRTRTLYLVIQVVFLSVFFLFWLRSVLKSGKKTNFPPNREQGSEESVLKPAQYIILFIWFFFFNFFIHSVIKLWRPVGSHSFVNSHDIAICTIRIKMWFRCKIGRDEETYVFDRDGMMFKVSIYCEDLP